MNDALGLIVTAIVAIWGILQTWRTSKLEQQIHMLNIQLDQRIQLLYRCREDVIKTHNAGLYAVLWMRAHEGTSRVDEILLEKMSEVATYRAELHGLVYAIKDNKLIELLEQEETTGNYSYIIPDAPQNLQNDELELRTRSRLYHKRIAELLQESGSS